jgi:hypothetical protein
MSIDEPGRRGAPAPSEQSLPEAPRPFSAATAPAPLFPLQDEYHPLSVFDSNPGAAAYESYDPEETFDALFGPDLSATEEEPVITDTDLAQMKVARPATPPPELPLP